MRSVTESFRNKNRCIRFIFIVEDEVRVAKIVGGCGVKVIDFSSKAWCFGGGDAICLCEGIEYIADVP